MKKELGNDDNDDGDNTMKSFETRRKELITQYQSRRDKIKKQINNNSMDKKTPTFEPKNAANKKKNHK